jgi:hypothetical protein
MTSTQRNRARKKTAKISPPQSPPGKLVASAADDHPKGPTLSVLHNGVAKAMPPDEAHQLLHSCTIGMVCPLVWVRHSLHDARYAGFVQTKDMAGLCFLNAILSLRPGNLLFREDLASALGENSIKKDVFTQRARRAAAILDVRGGDRPFEFVKVEVDRVRDIRAYRMKQGITWLVILDMGCGMTLADLYDLLEPPADPD